ncbi:hypothetical protein SOHN41_03786 [Shewanella sp. HN-41]|nr:hypothetical protein SOHN41_03786 [Shewanella sp. HN-41]
MNVLEGNNIFWVKKCPVGETGQNMRNNKMGEKYQKMLKDKSYASLWLIYQA